MVEIEAGQRVLFGALTSVLIKKWNAELWGVCLLHVVHEAHAKFTTGLIRASQTAIPLPNHQENHLGQF